MKKLSYLAVFVACYLAGFPILDASKAKPFKCQEEADKYLTTNYNEGCRYYNEQNYGEAYSHFEKVIHFFPSSEAAAEASYYLGVCYFEMKEYDFANREFSSYITASAHPAFFEDAVRFKFCIAEHFKHGKKRRAFSSRYCPKWLSAEDEALVIYDEVIIALPNHELTICALRSKAELLRRMGEYRESIDTYQALIRRFPRDESTPESYVSIAEVYCEQSQFEFQNPDILAFAELNARKFSEEFPRDERVEKVNGYVRRIKEIYAKGLYNLGLFYERKGHPHAAAIYYETSIAEFPDTDVAGFCRERLVCLDYSKENKDVVIPIATLIEERDPLAFEEKATPAEGEDYETLPIAPALEADPPSEEDYDKSINDIVQDPTICDDCAPLELSTEDFRQGVSFEEQPRSDEQQPLTTFKLDEGSHSVRFDQVNEEYYQDFEGGSETFVIDVPQEYHTQEPYAASDNDVYEEPYTVIGHEEDYYVTFENDKTIEYFPQPSDEPRRVYSIVRKKEPPPKVYAHYSLLKKRPVKRAHCQ